QLAPAARRLQPLRERDAVDELHGDEGAVAGGADVVDGDDVRVAEPGHRLRLAQEAGPGLGRAADLAAQHLDGDGALELGVVRRVDLAHAAAPDEALQRVAADDGGGREAALGALRLRPGAERPVVVGAGHASAGARAAARAPGPGSAARTRMSADRP